MLSPLALLPLLAGVALGQTPNYTEGLLTTLTGLNLTKLSGAFALVNASAEGQAILNMLALSGKNYTLFAPNDQGCPSSFISSLQCSGLTTRYS